MNGKGYCLLMSMALALGGAVSGYADAFHGTTFTGENGTEMVGMGYAGNEAQSAANRDHGDEEGKDGDGYGAVGYNYWIGKTAVSSSQFAASGVSGGNGSNNNSPVVFVSLYQARMYANWLTAEAGGTTFAYSADGETYLANHATLAASGELVYVIPNEDEWYKAAYYNVDDSSYSLYSTGLDSDPSTENFNFNNTDLADVNSSSILEQNGTIGMMGNVWEWINIDEVDEGVIRGGNYKSSVDELRSSKRYTASRAETTGYNIGFRVAAIPEPASMALIGLFGGGILFIRRIFMK